MPLRRSQNRPLGRWIPIVPFDLPPPVGHCLAGSRRGARLPLHQFPRIVWIATRPPFSQLTIGRNDFSISQEAFVPSNLVGLFAGIAIGLLVGFVYFLLWRAQYTARIRADAVQRSQAVTAGKVHEQLIPYLPAFPYNPKDVRFLGSPIDLVVFDGLAEGDLRSIVFLEVKTGASSLTSRERRVRDVILAREVEWVELRVAGRLAGAEKD